MSKQKTPQELRATAKPVAAKPSSEELKADMLSAKGAAEESDVTNEKHNVSKSVAPLKEEEEKLEKSYKEFTHLAKPVEQVAPPTTSKDLPNHDKVPRKMHKFL